MHVRRSVGSYVREGRIGGAMRPYTADTHPLQVERAFIISSAIAVEQASLAYRRSINTHMLRGDET